MAQKMTIANTIEVEDYTKEFEKCVSDYLTVDNPEYDKKLRMGLWLGDTPEKIKLYEKAGNKLILPYGYYDFMPAKYLLISEVVHKRSERPEIDLKLKEDLSLFDYQTEAVQAILRHGHGILKSPAGSGKTQMGLALIKEWSKRALWVTHTIDLLKQSRDRALRYFDSEGIGTITGGEVNIGDTITFATVQTLSNIDLSKWQNYWDVIIVDECHRCAGSPTQVTRFYKVLNSLIAEHKVGLSATVHRADGMIKATYALLGKIVYTVPDEAVGKKIMKVGIETVATGARLSMGAYNTDGTLNFAKMQNELAEDEERNEWIVNKIKRERGHSCLILVSRLSHIDNLIKLLPSDMQKEAAKISGKMSDKRGKEYRTEIIEKMRKGELKYLFATYQLAKEGLDIPVLDRLFMAAPQKDYAIITQSIGRIARTHEGKEEAVCYDFVDDFPFAIKAYKERWRTYRANKCYER